MAADIPDGWTDQLRHFIRSFPKTVDECDRMLTKNGIWVGRTTALGVMSADEAINYGLSGPMLRASGVAYDVRKDHPYLVYDRFDFDVPVGSVGDNFDRYAVRVEEIIQSMRILEQALEKIPAGPVMLADPRIALPPKSETYNSIEAMIAHFKIIMDGVHVPPGEVYSFTEAGNGELGFYIVSDGTGRPWKCRVRPPCFAATEVLQKVLPGLFIADVVPTFGMINMIGGECDR
jgi:NADH-quinone oxidoreductase subunit D